MQATSQINKTAKFLNCFDKNINNIKDFLLVEIWITLYTTDISILSYVHKYEPG